MPREFCAVQRAHVRVVRRPLIAAFEDECLTAGDSEIALMPVADRREPRGGFRKLVARTDHDVDVDDGFGCQPGNRGAADVLDPDREWTERVAEDAPQLLELIRPVGTI